MRPRSPLIGQVVFRGMVTESGDLVVLSVQRQGEEPDDAEAGARRRRHAAARRLLARARRAARSGRGAGRRRARSGAPPGGRARAWRAPDAGGHRGLRRGRWRPVWCRAAVAGLGAAIALVLLGVLDAEQAYRAVSWTTVILIAGLIPLSDAIQSTGAADDIAGILVDVVGESSPYLLLVGLFVLAAGFGVAVSNTATALILIPIGLAAGGRARRGPGADPDVPRRRLLGVVPDPDRHAREPDRDGSRRVPLRRLLALRPAVPRRSSSSSPCSSSRSSGRSSGGPSCGPVRPRPCVTGLAPTGPRARSRAA